jgi:hypothetical protein
VNMRKFLIGSAAVTLVMAMAACTPPAKEEAAAPEAAAEAEAAPAADAAAPAADGAAAAPAAAAGEAAAPATETAGDEHNGGTKVGDGK